MRRPDVRVWSPAPRGTVIHRDLRWHLQVRGTRLLPACVLSDSGAAAYPCSLCSDNVIVPITEGLCKISDDPHPGEGCESGSEPRAAILGSPSPSRGNCVQKQGVADLGVRGIYLESQACDLATNVPVTGEGDLMEPAAHFFPVRDCCPHRAVSVPLPRPPWLLSISAILTTLGKGGLFLDVTPLPLPCISPAPFCNGFPAVLRVSAQGLWVSVTGLGLPMNLLTCWALSPAKLTF